jgi:hypothetical protein
VAAGRLLVIAVVGGLLATPLGWAAVELRQSTPPRMALDPQAIAFARRATARLRDLPSCSQQRDLQNCWAINTLWKPGLINRTGPELECAGRVADLSAVTFKGGWSSRFDLMSASRFWQLTSAVLVLATPSQARVTFDATNAWLTRYCFVPGATRDSIRYTSVRRVPVPAVADQQAEVRTQEVLTSEPNRPRGETLILLRRGSVMIKLTFTWAKKPVSTPFIDAIVRKLATRAAR